ncbi:hypothetical protein RchiOBHm_Chr6g0268701 [Rosa chinensis]|uniref:Uncharacterized protein n=1 Tax=Rosa chinensis TaxID=74649 RepID=A0A2P6PQA8_ROSCH|nr:hypothetical protein RchiOBHm_Chr6g0268701 [Rosa chinensis]
MMIILEWRLNDSVLSFFLYSTRFGKDDDDNFGMEIEGFSSFCIFCNITMIGYQ